MESTSYEVQVLQGGKWRIHAQFPSGARDDAIEEAIALENMPGIAGIKVVRDTYDDRSGLHREHVVHKHTPTKSAAALSMSAASGEGNKYASIMARAQANRTPDFDDGMSSAMGRNQKKSGMGVVAKLLLVILFSIGVSAALTLILNATLPYKKLGGIAFYGQMRANVMMGAALSFFLLSVITTFRAFMGKDELDTPDFELLERRKKQQEEAQRKALAKKKAEEEKRALEEEKKRAQEEEDALKKQIEEELKKKAEEEAKAKPEESDKEEAPEQEAEEEAFSNLSPMAEKQKALLMGFFGESIRNLPAERKKMDNFNRFGVNLYLAGAAEALGGERNLDSESIILILTDALQLMGLKPEHAEAFARRYEDYLLQSAAYMEIFQAGRRDLSGFIRGNKETTANLETALHEWNKPAKPEDPEKEVVVMFTDIAGSTAMTHEKGNLAAQEVVRAHNQVVRDALAKTGGKEIKHTGDGIMASFENVTNSLRATQQMQMMIRMHNAQNPNVPLKVKIGINAGRAVVEENDLYGVTVQMAARVVDKAKADMIFVSDTVYGMAKGGSWRFVKRGPYYLKGIDGPVYLQEFIWDDQTNIEAVKAQAEAERPALEQAYVAASGVALPNLAPAAPQEAAPAATVPAAAPAPAPAPAQQPAAQPTTAQPQPPTQT
ncbi:MAG: adenylate/guanylate cyclase domain-containing protein [Rhodospirillales bacterium]|nr:adenylate/guanylate cyclase domain-containing protein [Rhodospirillales bacterium]